MNKDLFTQGICPHIKVQRSLVCTNQKVGTTPNVHQLTDRHNGILFGCEKSEVLCGLMHIIPALKTTTRKQTKPWTPQQISQHYTPISTPKSNALTICQMLAQMRANRQSVPAAGNAKHSTLVCTIKTCTQVFVAVWVLTAQIWGISRFFFWQTSHIKKSTETSETS